MPGTIFFHSRVRFLDVIGSRDGNCSGFAYLPQFSAIYHTKGAVIIFWYNTQRQDSQPIYERHWFIRWSTEIIFTVIPVSNELHHIHDHRNHIQHADIRCCGAGVGWIIFILASKSLQWRHMSVMASHINDNLAVVQQLVQTLHKKYLSFKFC